jgi:hypothetical protein
MPQLIIDPINVDRFDPTDSQAAQRAAPNVCRSGGRYLPSADPTAASPSCTDRQSRSAHPLHDRKTSAGLDTVLWYRVDTVCRSDDADQRSGWTGRVNVQTLRYYERRGLLPKPPRRNDRHHRRKATCDHCGCALSWSARTRVWGTRPRRPRQQGGRTRRPRILQDRAVERIAAQADEAHGRAG